MRADSERIVRMIWERAVIKTTNVQANGGVMIISGAAHDDRAVRGIPYALWKRYQAPDENGGLAQLHTVLNNSRGSMHLLLTTLPCYGGNNNTGRPRRCSC